MRHFSVGLSMSSAQPVEKHTADVTADDALADPRLRTSPGINLVARREAYGVTVEQVANQLNLAPRQIMALEADDYTALPAAAIARGFLRSYAKLLQLDPVPLLAMLGPAAPLPGNLHPNVPAIREVAKKQSSKVSALALRSNAFPIIAGITALFVVGVASYAMGWVSDTGGRRDEASKLSPTTSNSIGSELRSADGGADPVVTSTKLSDVAPGQVSKADASDEVMPAVSIGMLEQTLGASRLKPPMQPSGLAVLGTQGQNNTSLGMANPLVLNLQQDSWVEIKRADNTPVVAKILRSGSVETFDVNEPMTLIIGNAAGVVASFRNAPLNVAGNGNVARVKLK